jgi:hypothetical protein
MKLRITEVEARLTAAWGKQATVVVDRIAGNRYRYAVTDHDGHWLPLETSWAGCQQVFEPVEGTWPGTQVPDSWLKAVLTAAGLARVYFVDRGNRQALSRLPRAQVLAEAREWTRLGDALDTWLMPSRSRGGVIYRVNGRCTCPDYLQNGVPGGWCKHRIARGLAKRAAQILENENGAGGDNTPAPASMEATMNGGTDSTTTPASGQARRIDLIVGYEADEARSLARINGDGQLVAFKVDGEEKKPPLPTLPELYRWLQGEGFVPAEFRWLGWEHGLRQRLQSYTRTDGRDTALPAEHSRGRSRLFKE